MISAIMNSHRPLPSTGKIFKIQKYAIHDGPGIRTTVFFKGCPLQCRWCHNPESISPVIEAIRTGGGREEPIGRVLTVSEVLAEIEKDRIFYEESGGGVTLSGGEPLMQPDFALALARACAELDLHVALDTSGHGDRAGLDSLLQWVDLVLFDLKLVDAELHRQYTGVDNELILAHLHHLDSGVVPYRIRFPVIPGITDTPAALEQLTATLAGLQRRPAIDLLAYHPAAEAKYERLGLEYPLRGLKPPSAERMDRIASRLSRHGFKTHMGG
jgi:pyruvate formate lyase activating enzyme